MGWLQYGNVVDNQLGICNGAIGDLPTHDFSEYHKKCTSQRIDDLGGQRLAVIRTANTPIRTRYVPFYRIHSRKHFHSAEHFYRNWDVSERRLEKHDRFSPTGTLGFYFGATLDAAIDEALYYGDGEITNDHFILVLDVCLDNILYLMHPVILKLVWAHLQLPVISIFDMYLSIMDDDRQSDICNTISGWARSNGYEGILYPSARFGQKFLSDLAPENMVPAVNFVELGSQICRGATEPAMWFNQQLFAHLNKHSPDAIPVFAEPNLVMFDIEAIGGLDRAIFYWTFNLNRSEDISRMDRRLGSKSYTMFANDYSGFSVGYISPHNVQLLGEVLGSGKEK